MADRNLYRYGGTYPVAWSRLTGFAIQRGDMCWFDGTVIASDAWGPYPAGSPGALKSAASFVQGQGVSLAAMQAAFAPLFVGVSGQRFPITGNNPPVFGGQDGLIRVDTGGVFEFDKQLGLTFGFGALVAPDGSSVALLPQQVNLAVSKATAIGRVAKYAGPTEPAVLVEIFTALLAPLTNA